MWFDSESVQDHWIEALLAQARADLEAGRFADYEVRGRFATETAPASTGMHYQTLIVLDPSTLERPEDR